MKRLPLLLIFTATAMAALSGCDSGGLETTRVHGTVTFDGGPPPTEGMVYFVLADESPSQSIHPGRAAFDDRGRFELTSIKKGDGLVPGSYRVRVECWKVAPTMDAPDKAESYVGEGFESPTIDIPADGGTVDVPIDVPLAR